MEVKRNKENRKRKRKWKRKLVEEAKGNLECKERKLGEEVNLEKKKWKVLEYGGSLEKKCSLWRKERK